MQDFIIKYEVIGAVKKCQLQDPFTGKVLKDTYLNMPVERTMHFDSPALARKWLKKNKYSKKIKITYCSKEINI